jgi:hypothetical protein
VKKLPKKIEDASDRAFRKKYQSGGGRWSGGLESGTRAGLAALSRSPEVWRKPWTWYLTNDDQ